MKRLVILLAALFVAAVVCDASAQHSMPAAPATSPPLFAGLGDWTHAVATQVPQAQRYFDQGLKLYYGFNQDEAQRAFREAARLDPKGAMAWWGVAYVVGPNINFPMDDEHAAIANEAIAKAVALKAGANDRDRAYIDALATRYSTDPKRERAALDTTYSNAMRALAKRFPDDADAAALYAESMLDLNPWNQWTLAGAPNPGTLEVLSVLEAGMKRWPKHPGMNHFYIHAIEASPHPDRGLGAASRLEDLAPALGHLVHMPSHIYARVGRYDDAVERNQLAAAADEKYIAAEKPAGVYPLMYYTHNIQFIWFCSMMEGRSADALAAARKMVGNVPEEIINQMPMLELVPPYPVLTLARFGRWSEVLEEPAPPPGQKYATGVWNYAQGVAHAARGEGDDARRSLAAVQSAARSVPSDLMISINLAGMLLRTASHTLAGEIALRERKSADAIRELQLAVAAEDSLHYDEPPTWYYPVRQSLGAALLGANRAKEAEAVYQEDLRRHPDNGWSLYGLMLAQRAQGRTRDADATEAQYKQAWARADVTLTGSAF